MKYGYTFEIKRGYIFEQANVFSNYVLDLYEIKNSHDKSHPLYFVSKLLLNSLYGKFGMNYEQLFESQIIINNNELFDLIDNNTITEVLDLENNKSLISITDDNKIENYLHEDIYSNISVSISSSITAYSRIFMSYYKIKYSDSLFYSDTDSIFLNIDLDKKFIGTEIGK
jgi:hypothetical protein